MSTKGPERQEIVKRGVVTAPLAAFPPMTIEWLWPGRIALDGLTLLVGDPDVGKSYLALDIAARVSRGGAWPDGQPSTGAGGVLLLSAEDHLYRTIRPALDAAKGDLSQICCPYLTREVHETGPIDRPINFKRDLDAIFYTLETRPGCKLVIVDPFSAFLGNGAGAKHADVVSVLQTLHGLAVKYHVAVLAVTHLRRGGGGQAIHRAVGGLAITTMARAIWMVVREEVSRREKVESRGERRLLLPVKNNLAPEGTALAFALVKEEGQIAPRVEWMIEVVEGGEEIDDGSGEPSHERGKKVDNDGSGEPSQCAYERIESAG